MHQYALREHLKLFPVEVRTVNNVKTFNNDPGTDNEPTANVFGNTVIIIQNVLSRAFKWTYRHFSEAICLDVSQEAFNSPQANGKWTATSVNVR